MRARTPPRAPLSTRRIEGTAGYKIHSPHGEGFRWLRFEASLLWSTVPYPLPDGLVVLVTVLSGLNGIEFEN